MIKRNGIEITGIRKDTGNIIKVMNRGRQIFPDIEPGGSSKGVITIIGKGIINLKCAIVDKWEDTLDNIPVFLNANTCYDIAPPQVVKADMMYKKINNSLELVEIPPDITEYDFIHGTYGGSIYPNRLVHISNAERNIDISITGSIVTIMNYSKVPVHYLFYDCDDNLITERVINTLHKIIPNNNGWSDNPIHWIYDNGDTIAYNTCNISLYNEKVKCLWWKQGESTYNLDKVPFDENGRLIMIIY